MDTRLIEVTTLGETRTIEVYAFGDRIDRLDSVGQIVVGRFPTGTKIHRSQLTLWQRNANPNRPLRGDTAAVVDGEEYVADKTLYTHNRNVGRIVGWYEPAQADAIARW